MLVYILAFLEGLHAVPHILHGDISQGLICPKTDAIIFLSLIFFVHSDVGALKIKFLVTNYHDMTLMLGNTVG